MWCSGVSRCREELEMFGSRDECSSEEVDDSCLSHSSDAIVFCGMTSLKAFSDGELRLVGGAGAPALPGEAGRLEMFRAASQVWAPLCKLGFTSGSASVACKQMGYSGSAGFAGCTSKETCGAVPPQVSELTCGGAETTAGVLHAADLRWARQPHRIADKSVKGLQATLYLWDNHGCSVLW